MKKTIILSFLICLNTILYGQILNGKVIDKQTNAPVEAATVYLNGTFVGTSTDSSGHFSLDVSKYPNMPLSISVIGYYSFILEDFPKDKPLLILLDPKVIELNAIIIKAKSLKSTRKSNMLLFKREFLGTGPNSQKCKILNENDIYFVYSQEDDTLKAYSHKPLVIENKSLGYKLTYFLDEFKFSRYSRNLYFIGNVVFNEDNNIKKSTKRSFDKQRKYTYLGSRMHFMRALWNNDLKSAGFKIKDTKNNFLSFENIVQKDKNDNKFLTFKSDIKVEYKKSSSGIKFLKKYVYFDKEGYFYPLDLQWRGTIANQRISDFLPYEYTIK